MWGYPYSIGNVTNESSFLWTDSVAALTDGRIEKAENEDERREGENEYDTEARHVQVEKDKGNMIQDKVMGVKDKQQRD